MHKNNQKFKILPVLRFLGPVMDPLLNITKNNNKIYTTIFIQCQNAVSLS